MSPKAKATAKARAAAQRVRDEQHERANCMKWPIGSPQGAPPECPGEFGKSTGVVLELFLIDGLRMKRPILALRMVTPRMFRAGRPYGPRGGGGAREAGRCRTPLVRDHPSRILPCALLLRLPSLLLLRVSVLFLLMLLLYLPLALPPSRFRTSWWSCCPCCACRSCCCCVRCCSPC